MSRHCPRPLLGLSWPSTSSLPPAPPAAARSTADATAVQPGRRRGFPVIGARPPTARCTSARGRRRSSRCPRRRPRCCTRSAPAARSRRWTAIRTTPPQAPSDQARPGYSPNVEAIVAGQARPGRRVGRNAAEPDQASRPVLHPGAGTWQPPATGRRLHRVRARSARRPGVSPRPAARNAMNSAGRSPHIRRRGPAVRQAGSPTTTNSTRPITRSRRPPLSGICSALLGMRSIADAATGAAASGRIPATVLESTSCGRTRTTSCSRIPSAASRVRRPLPSALRLG